VRLSLLSSLLSVSLFFFFAGCGGNSSTTITPAFTNATLVGAYTLTTSGVNANGPFTLQAVFSMDGKGLISTGSTFYDSTTTGAAGGQAMTGTYLVSGDGSVQIGLDTQIIGSVSLNVVLASPQHGQVVRFENSATASGTLDKQDATAFGQTSIAGTFAFNVKGRDQAGNPRASVGVFTADAAGNILGGLIDTNDNGVLSTNGALTPGAPSELEIVPSLGRGILQFVTPNDGLIAFNAIAVDNNHFKLSGSFPAMVTGDAYRVTDMNVPNAMAFTMAGTSFNNAPVGSSTAYATGGILVTDGAGNFLNTSIRDVNTGGLPGNSNLTGTYFAVGNRVTMELNGTFHMVGYPSSGGMQLLSLENDTIASGVAYAQTGPFSNATASGSYSVSMSGQSTKGEVDAVAQLNSSGPGTLSGSLTLNEAGALTSGFALTTTYSADAIGRGPGTLVTTDSSQNVMFYTVDSSRILFIEFDSKFVVQGMLVKQTVQ
jgi:hypothetical protein